MFIFLSLLDWGDVLIFWPSGIWTYELGITATHRRSSGWFMILSNKILSTRFESEKSNFYSNTFQAVQSIKRFLRLTKELVILDFHRFPFGFTGENTEGRHEELVSYIIEELGEFMAPDWLGKAATMNDLWHLNRTLIVTYQDDLTENKFDNLWTEALHAWGDTKHPGNLFRYLNNTMNTKQSATYMWVAMTHLTPSAMDVLWNLSGGLRQMNDKIAKYCWQYC